MPITFESIKDPWGIGAAGSALAEGLRTRFENQRADKKEELQNQRQIDMEKRKIEQQEALKQKYGALLGPALAVAQDQNQPMPKRLGALQQYISETGDTSVMPMMKELSKEGRTSSVLAAAGLGQPGQAPVNPMEPRSAGESAEAPAMMQGQPAGQPAAPARGLKDLSEDQLISLLQSGDPVVTSTVESEFKRRDMDQRKFQEERKYHERGTKNAEEEVRKLRSSIPRQKMALSLAKDSIDSGEVGIFSLNNLAEKTGFKELQTAKGAQLVTAMKENLLSSLSRMAAKGQNIWMEQRIASMAPEIGKSQEANQTTYEMLQAEVEMNDAYLKNYSELEKQDIDKYTYVKRDIDKRAREMTDKDDAAILQKTSFKLRQIYESEKGSEWMLKNALKPVPKGTILTPQMAVIMSKKYDGDFKKAIENAKKLGYDIPTRDEVLKWQ